MKFIFYIKFFIYIIFSIFQLYSYAKDANSSFPCSKTYNIALSNHNIIYNPETNTGLDKDFIDALQKVTKCRFNFQTLPRERIWYSLKKGDIDFSSSVIPYPERKEFAFFASYFFSKNLVIVRKNTLVKSMDDFIKNKEFVFGDHLGRKYGNAKIDKFIADLKLKNRVETSTSDKSLEGKLRHNRIQGYVINNLIAKYNMTIWDKNFKNDIEIQDWTPTDRGFLVSIGFSKVNITEEEFKYWQKAINRLLTEGTAKKIYLKYFKTISKLDEETLEKLRAETENINDL